MTTTQDTLKTDAPRGRIVPGGLKANLAANREETLRWVEDAPLRLVAAVLLDAPRRTAKMGELRDALTPEVMESRRWKSWWDVVRPRLDESSQFVYSRRDGTRLRVSNLSDIASSSLDELRASNCASSNGASQSSNGASTATPAKASAGAGRTSEKARAAQRLTGQFAWAAWVWAKEEKQTPNPAPPSDFPKFLRELDEDAGKVVSRLVSGIRQRLLGAKQKPGDKTIESWHESLVAALNRWNNLSDPLDDLPLEDVVVVTAHVLHDLGRSEFQDVVEWMAAYTSVGESSVKAMSDAILDASRKSPQGANVLLDRLSKLLDSPVRKSLWLELMQSDLATRRDEGLLRKWLEMLNAEERADAITYLLGAVQGGDSIKVVDSMLRAEWEAAGAERRARLSDAVMLSWQRQNVSGFALNGVKTAAQLEGWLKILEPDDQYDVIAYLLRTVRNESVNEAIVPVLQSEMGRADAMRRHFFFDSVVVGHKVLSEYANEMVRQAVAGLAQNGQATGGLHLSELQRMIRRDAHAEVEVVRDEMKQQLEEKELELSEKELELEDRDRDMEKTTAELESTKRRRDFLRREIRTKRQNTELDITRDAITILGIALQELATSSKPKSDDMSRVESRITLALSTLGVKPVGEVGETVEFDPRLHETDNEPDLGTLVEVTAPGMQFSRRKDNPLNVVKMQVKA